MSLPYLQPYLGLSNGLNTLHAAGGPGGAVGGWVELGRTTLGGAGSTIDVSSLPDKRYYMLLTYGSDSSGGGTSLTFNGDTGSNYAWRRSENGTGETAVGNQTLIINDGGGTAPRFCVDYIANYSSKEKLTIHHMVTRGTAGAANAPPRAEVVGKWANTSNAINQITQNASGNWSSGDELVVLGWDPADTHTNNFWQELGSASGDSITDLTLSADKKYLWFQGWLGFNGNLAFNIRFGDGSLDSGSNYARRQSSSGAPDSLLTSQSNINMGAGWDTQYKFHINGFIINNSSAEKLGIIHWHWIDTGDGATVAPQRGELFTKWANTSGQIDHIGFVRDASSFSSESELRVWGAN